MTKNDQTCARVPTSPEKDQTHSRVLFPPLRTILVPLKKGSAPKTRTTLVLQGGYNVDVFNGVILDDMCQFRTLLETFCMASIKRSDLVCCGPSWYLPWQCEKLNNFLLGSYNCTEFKFHNEWNTLEKNNMITLGHGNPLYPIMKTISVSMDIHGPSGIDYIRLLPSPDNGCFVIFPPMYNYDSYDTVAFLSLKGHFTFFLKTDTTSCRGGAGMDLFLETTRKELSTEVSPSLMEVCKHFSQDDEEVPTTVHCFSCYPGSYLKFRAKYIHEAVIIINTKVDDALVGELLFFYKHE